LAAQTKSRKRSKRRKAKVSTLRAGKVPATFALTIDPSQEREKPRLMSLLFFDYANTTLEGKLNLMGVFDRIYVDQVTKKTTPIGIFVRVCKAWDYPFRVTIISPDNKPIGGITIGGDPAKYPPDQKRPDQLQALGRVEFQATIEGTYWIDVSYGEQSLGGGPLVLEFRNLKEMMDVHTRGDA